MSTPVHLHYILYKQDEADSQDSLEIRGCAGTVEEEYRIPSNDKALSLTIVKLTNDPSSHRLIVDDNAALPTAPWQAIEVKRIIGNRNCVLFMRDHDRKDFNLLFLGTEDLRPDCSYKLPVYHCFSLYLVEVRMYFSNGKLQIAYNPEAPNAAAAYSRLLVRQFCPDPEEVLSADMPTDEEGSESVIYID